MIAESAPLGHQPKTGGTCYWCWFSNVQLQVEITRTQAHVHPKRRLLAIQAIDFKDWFKDFPCSPCLGLDKRPSRTIPQNTLNCRPIDGWWRMVEVYCVYIESWLAMLVRALMRIIDRWFPTSTGTIWSIASSLKWRLLCYLVWHIASLVVYQVLHIAHLTMSLKVGFACIN